MTKRIDTLTPEQEAMLAPHTGAVDCAVTGAVDCAVTGAVDELRTINRLGKSRTR